MRKKTTPAENKVLEIEATTISGIIKPFFDEHGIDFEVSVVGKDIILSAHIRDNIWMNRAITIDEINGLLDIIPYLIARPKCISYDGHGFYCIQK